MQMQKDLVIYFVDGVLENAISILKNEEYQRKTWFTSEGTEVSSFIDTVAYFIGECKKIFSIPNYSKVLGEKKSGLLNHLYKLVRQFVTKAEYKIDFCEDDFEEEELMSDPEWQEIIRVSKQLYEELSKKGKRK